MTKKYRLCVELASCTTPLDEDVVYGIVEALLVAGLPAAAKPKEIAAMLKANAMCMVPVLSLMDEEKLEGLEVLVGYAVLVCSVLRAPAAATPSPPAHQPPVYGPPSTPGSGMPPPMPVPFVREIKLREFPDCEASGYPSRAAFELWWLALETVLSGQPALLSAIQARAISPTWVPGCVQDQALHRILVNGSGRVPDSILVMVPQALKDLQAGLGEALWLRARVCTHSSSELAEKEDQFRTQKAVLPARKHLLGQVLAVWEQLRCELEARGSRQSEAQVTASLHKMVSKLPEVVTRLGAAEAAWETTNSHPLPADKLVQAVQKTREDGCKVQLCGVSSG